MPDQQPNNIFLADRNGTPFGNDLQANCTPAKDLNAEVGQKHVHNAGVDN